MQNEMVEKVARAIQKANYEVGRKLAPPWPTDIFEQERWYGMARAAIKTMREPTEVMWDAAWEAGEDYFVGDSISASGLKKALSAAIDAALLP